MSEPNLDQLLRRLDKIADELAAIASRERSLFAQRVEIWKQARALGASASDLARRSRVKAVTVRQLIQRSEGD